MKKTKKTVKKVSKKTNPNALEKLKEENEMLRLQLMAREKERDEYKRELEEIHESISYHVGRRIAETEFGIHLKKFLKNHMRK